MEAKVLSLHPPKEQIELENRFNVALKDPSLGFTQESHRLKEFTHKIAKTPSQFEIMSALYRNTLGDQEISTCVTVRTLAEQTGYHRNTIHTALKDFERRGLIRYEFKSDHHRSDTPSLIVLDWLQAFLPEEQKKLRNAAKSALNPIHFNSNQYGPDNQVSEVKKQMQNLQENSKKCDRAVTIQDQLSHPHCDRPVTKIVTLKRRRTNIDNSSLNRLSVLETNNSAQDFSFQDSPFVSPPVKFEKEKNKNSHQGEIGEGGPCFGDLPPIDCYEDLANRESEEFESYFGNQEIEAGHNSPIAIQTRTDAQESKNLIEVRGKEQEISDRSLKPVSVEISVPPVAAKTSDAPKFDSYANLRKLLLVRWNAFKAEGRPFKAEKEKRFFTEAKEKYPEDLNLIYLTLLKLEKEGKDFGGYAVGDPLSKLQWRWTGMREVAAQHFGDKAREMATLSPEEFQERKEKRQNEVKSVLEQKHESPIKINEEVSIYDQVRAFEERFQGEERITAVRKWTSGFFKNLEGRPGLLAAASFWFISNERKAELKAQNEEKQEAILVECQGDAAVPVQAGAPVEIQKEVQELKTNLDPKIEESNAIDFCDPILAEDRDSAYEVEGNSLGLSFNLKASLRSIPCRVETHKPSGNRKELRESGFSKLGLDLVHLRGPPNRLAL